MPPAQGLSVNPAKKDKKNKKAAAAAERTEQSAEEDIVSAALTPQDSALEGMEQDDQSSDDAAVDAGASLYDSFIGPMPKPGTYVPQTGLAAAPALRNARDVSTAEQRIRAPLSNAEALAQVTRRLEREQLAREKLRSLHRY